MAIAKLKDKPVIPPTVDPIKPYEEKFKGNTVDSRFESIANLITYVEGSAWSVTYYSQVLGQDNEATGQSLGTSAVQQQYKLIENFILKVTSPLSPSQDSATKVFNVVGTSNCYPCLIPNRGDIFRADVGDGTEAIFEITNTERKSIFKESTYTVEYKLVDYSTPERLKDLENKVIASYVFNRNMLAYNLNPIIQKSEDVQREDLEQHMLSMTRSYVKIFFSKEFQTFVVPDQPRYIYDHFLVKVIRACFNSGASSELKKLRVLNIDDDYLMRTDTVWDAITDLDYSVLNYSANRYGLVQTRVFSAQAVFENIRYTGIDYAVYPVGAVESLDAQIYKHRKILSAETIKDVPGRMDLPPSTPRPIEGYVDFNYNMVPPYEDAKDGLVDGIIHPTDGSGTSPLPDGYQYSDVVVTDTSGYTDTPLTDKEYDDIISGISNTEIIGPDIHKVTLDNYYVFTEGFYKFNNGLQGPGMSLLEVMVCRMIRKLTIDKSELIRLCKSYHYWGAVERFYYVPVLVLLIKYSLSYK